MKRSRNRQLDRPAEGPAPPPHDPPGVVNGPTEVVGRPQRRRFTARYKLAILKAIEACTGHGEVGALLRKEGLYSSLVSRWRKALEAGQLGALDAPRGRKPLPEHVRLARENHTLQKKNEQLEEKLRKAEIIIEYQKKVAAILGMVGEVAPTDSATD